MPSASTDPRSAEAEPEASLRRSDTGREGSRGSGMGEDRPMRQQHEDGA